MRNLFKKGIGCVAVVLCALVCVLPVKAASAAIKPGIYAGDISLGGMTGEEAEAAVQAYIEELQNVEITLVVADNNEVVTTAGELGIAWANTEIITEALEIGSHGNVIQRYKVLKDLEHENKIYPIELSFDMQAVNDILEEKGTAFDVEAKSAFLKRIDGEFQVEEGRIGYKLDVESSIDLLYDYLINDWERTTCRVVMDVAVDEPQGKAEDLAQVTDILGTFTTNYSTSGSSRSANVENGCSLINGTTLYPGEEFSTYLTVSPFSVENGYFMAGSYLNGKVVDSLGGGICQVSTTLYNAVLLSELEVTERHNHSMIVSYVSPSADAAIAESAGKDFRFVNNTDYPIYIEGYTKGKKITFNIYGKETRDEGHKVQYESEILEVNTPPADMIYADPSKPIGYIVTESAHIGYKARLWKVVKENGVEVSRETINSSTYKMSPRSATVGTATSDPNAAAEINAAIGTASIDHVKAVIALLLAPPAPAPEG